MESSNNPLNKLITKLSLETQTGDTFIGGSGTGGVTVENRLFGGLLVAQAFMAAAKTSSLDLHSLHSYFLRPARPNEPILYHVSKIKEGKNFHVRLVEASQGDSPIFHMQASFTKPLTGPGHQDRGRPNQHAPPPSGAKSLADAAKNSSRCCEIVGRCCQIFGSRCRNLRQPSRTKLVSG